ncbi:MAG: thioredoxin family protein [Planctomycetota bacterium]
MTISSHQTHCFTTRVTMAAIAFIYLMTTCGGYAQEAIFWHHDFATARQQAVTQDRLLLIEFTSKHCPWCREMEKETHPDQAVIAAVQQDYVALRLEGNPDGIKQVYDVNGTPRTLILEPRTQTLLQRIKGFKRPGVYISELADARDRLQLFQQSPDAFSHLQAADTAMRKRHWEEAIAQTTAALADAPDSRAVRNQRGYVLTILGRHAEALADFDAAIETGEPDATLRFEHSLALYGLGRYAEAAEGFCRAAEMRRGNASYEAVHAWCAMIADDGLVAAQTYLDQHLRNHRYDRSESWSWRMVKYAAGKIDEEQLLNYSKRSYQKLQAQRLMGMRAWALDGPNAASTYFEAALNTDAQHIYDYSCVAADYARLISGDE